MFGGYDYDDGGDFYHESSGNMLVDHYHATNLAHGHERGCPYGAGADCTCKAGEFLAFVVRVKFATGWMPIECTTDAKVGNREAQKARKKYGNKRVEYKCEKMHSIDGRYEELRESCEICRDKILDWETD